MRYLVDYLEFYIAFDIILMCLTGDCFINKLKLRHPFKSYEIGPQYAFSGFLPIHQCNVDKFVVFQTSDGNRFAKEIGLECGIV